MYFIGLKVGTHDATSRTHDATSRILRTASKSSRRDQNLVPATSPTNSNWFEFVELVAGTKVGPCD